MFVSVRAGLWALCRCTKSPFAMLDNCSGLSYAGWKSEKRAMSLFKIVGFTKNMFKVSLDLYTAFVFFVFAQISSI